MHNLDCPGSSFSSKKEMSVLIGRPVTVMRLWKVLTEERKTDLHLSSALTLVHHAQQICFRRSPVFLFVLKDKQCIWLTYLKHLCLFLYLTLIIIICSNELQQKAEQTIIIMLRSQIQPRVADAALSVSKRRSRFSGVLHSLRWLYCMGV